MREGSQLTADYRLQTQPFVLNVSRIHGTAAARPCSSIFLPFGMLQHINAAMLHIVAFIFIRRFLRSIRVYIGFCWLALACKCLYDAA